MAAVLTVGLFALACSSTPPRSADDTSADVTAAEPPRIVFSDASVRIGSPVLRAYGVSLVDYDDDGWPDVTIAYHEGLLAMRGDGKGGFLPDNVRSRLPQGLLDGHAVVWADVDGDDDLDLFVGRRSLMGQNRPKEPVGCALFENTGGAVFQDITTRAGLERPGYWEGAAFGDLDGDEDLDLVVAGGVQPNSNGAAGRGHNGTETVVYRNDGSGRFEEVGAAIGCKGSASGEGWGVLLADVDLDGDLDVLVANDSAPATFCRNQGSGVFVEDPAFALDSQNNGVMGWSVGDIVGDGCPDIYGSIFGPSALFTLNAEGAFPNAYGSLLGLGYDPSAPVSGWGTAIDDFNHDGFQDLLWVAAEDNGTSLTGVPLVPGVLAVLAGMPREGGQPGGVGLVDVSDAAGPLFGETHNGYGLATGDIDRDGDLDVLIGVDSVLRGVPIEGQSPLHKASMLLLNDSPSAGATSLMVTLRQPGPNRRAVGATITVHAAGRSSLHVVTAGDSYVSCSDYPAHFGLGGAASAEWVRVRWPDGQTHVFTGVPAGRVELAKSGEPCVPAGSCGAVPAVACAPFSPPPAPAPGCGPAGVTVCPPVCARVAECGWFQALGVADEVGCREKCLRCPPSNADADKVIHGSCDSPPDMPSDSRGASR